MTMHVHRFGFHRCGYVRHGHLPSLRGALATKQSILPSRRHGLLRFARNDVARVGVASRLWTIRKKRDVTPGRAGQHGGSQDVTSATRHRAALVTSRLHVVVVRILADVADIEDDGFLAEVLPPVRGAGD